jgi:ApaG protein
MATLRRRSYLDLRKTGHRPRRGWSRDPLYFFNSLLGPPGYCGCTPPVLESRMRYEQSTDGIRVCVQPRFSLADSAPEDGTFVFSYEIEMENQGDDSAQLLFRHWLIHDAAGDDTEVDGEGVVGQQPHLQPGDSHEYRSYCVLRSPVGYMEGYYTFVRPNGSQFRVEVPRFALSGPHLMQTPQVQDDEGDAQVMN